MKTLFNLLPVICLFIFGNAKSQDNSGNQAPIANGEMKTFSESNYAIQYPPEWGLNLDKQMGMSFIILSPLESEQDKFKENVNLLIQDLTGKDIDLKKYTEISEEQIKTMVTNSNLIVSERKKTASLEYQKVIYSGDQGIFHLKFEQYYWVIGDQAYVLTLTTEKDKFDAFRVTGEKILNSFTLNH